MEHSSNDNRYHALKTLIAEKLDGEGRRLLDELDETVGQRLAEYGDERARPLASEVNDLRRVLRAAGHMLSEVAKPEFDEGVVAGQES